MNYASNQLLKSFRLRSTPIREEILHLFLEKEYALSHSDIETEIAKEFDRVTVYRTLKTFSDKGLIHKVLDDKGGLKYALCPQECSATGHRHEHVHFKCTRCGQTNCLDIQIPLVKLPKGYVTQEVNFLIQGTCQNCSI
ncbi:MAG TPA: transcriptional repressor [Chryseosolibacter sp.]|jgi:Fur family ferric uptake transcriptional regulator|nr:transcriptional repressor [Chryseosolibacter sp.]